ncbi:MAG TPA: hypothetical protein VHA14_14660 [Bryobacteraceae bacterium]|jgi:hypothetical protein|nr:hypothetical protein [Bryobacteraceae bacterium]
MREKIIKAVGDLAALKYFPSDEGARVALMELLDRMVSTPEQLRWLVRTLIDRVGEYPGPAEIRAVFCTRFRPKDSVEVWSALPGFTAADSERKYIAASDERKAAEQIPAAALKQFLLEAPSEKKS